MIYRSTTNTFFTPYPQHMSHTHTHTHVPKTHTVRDNTAVHMTLSAQITPLVVSADIVLAAVHSTHYVHNEMNRSDMSSTNYTLCR